MGAKITVVALVLSHAICGARYVSGQSPVQPSPSPTSEDSSRVLQPTNVDSGSPRLDRLEATVELIREYNDDFMSVVLWSLGAVVGLTILLAGFNSFQNNRMLQRELESVRSELKALIASQVSEAERPLAQRIDARLSEVESQLKKTVETTVTKATAPLIGKVDDIGNRLGNIEFASHKAEFDHWLTKGVPSNACSKAAQLIDKAVDLHNEYDISQSLNLLSTALDALGS